MDELPVITTVKVLIERELEKNWKYEFSVSIYVNSLMIMDNNQ